MTIESHMVRSSMVLWTAIKRGQSANCKGIKYKENRSTIVVDKLNNGIAKMAVIPIHFIIFKSGLILLILSQKKSATKTGNTFIEARIKAPAKLPFVVVT